MAIETIVLVHGAFADGSCWAKVIPLLAKRDYGIGACEYVNQFFKDKAHDEKYLAELNRRAAGEGVQNVLIMIDDEGALGDPDPAKRQQAVENHHRWVDAAKTLGCHAIRVNAHSKGTYDETMKLVADGLGKLVEYGAQHQISVPCVVQRGTGRSESRIGPRPSLVRPRKTLRHPYPWRPDEVVQNCYRFVVK